MSTPLLNASCREFGFAAPVSAINETDSDPVRARNGEYVVYFLCRPLWA